VSRELGKCDFLKGFVNRICILRPGSKESAADFVDVIEEFIDKFHVRWNRHNWSIIAIFCPVMENYIDKARRKGT
jgi:hypothetical protein